MLLPSAPAIRLGLYHLMLFLLLTGPCLGCNPGHRGYRSRRRGKLTPLVYKQHIPNVSENTLGASGLSDGSIKRTDPKFKELVRNFNPEIIFKDEEGTGDDRIMTERCKEKLDVLAVSVMNHWPGVRVRVSEAWDDGLGDHHVKDSLHYEGRAVDIATSDRDRSKNGMLARLAVEAGFDWVYFDTRSHVHCSVKSDSSIAVKNGGCFPGTSTVTMEDGSTRPLSRLDKGERILTVTDTGALTFSEVIMFMDKDNVTRAAYIDIETETGSHIKLTGSHLLFVSEEPGSGFAERRTAFAREVKPGDYVYIRETSRRTHVSASKVVKVSLVETQGVFAPLTKHGTIVVDDVAASCYAVINNQDIAHFAFAPVRMYHAVTKLFYGAHAQKELSVRSSTSQHGVHWYADSLYRIAPYLLGPDFWYQS